MQYFVYHLKGIAALQMSFCLPGCHLEMVVSECFERHCLHVVSVTLGMDQGEAAPTLSQPLKLGPGPPGKTSQSLSSSQHPTTFHAINLHLQPMCLYVSLGPSLCPPLKGLILQLVCTFDIEIDSSAEQVEPPGRLCVFGAPS